MLFVHGHNVLKKPSHLISFVCHTPCSSTSFQTCFQTLLISFLSFYCGLKPALATIPTHSSLPQTLEVLRACRPEPVPGFPSVVNLVGALLAVNATTVSSTVDTAQLHAQMNVLPCPMAPPSWLLGVIPTNTGKLSKYLPTLWAKMCPG